MPGGTAALAYREEEELEAANDVVIEEGAAVAGPSVAETLTQLINLPNIVPELTETELSTIGQQVIQDYDTDKASRKEWETRTEAAQKLAMMVAEKKDYPFVGASNVKYPLVTQAALQFNARAYPAVVQGDRACKVKTYGNDSPVTDEQGQVVRPGGLKAARAERVSEHLSWQLTAEMPEWEPDMDRLLVILPIIGTVFRKTYFDPSLSRKCSRLVQASRFVINYWARSIEDAPRFTEELPLYPRDIQERILDGRFAEFDYTGTPSAHPSDQDKNPPTENDDLDAEHLFLEQHRLLDLDGDGYREPYIVTVHKDSEKVCRIVANYTLDTVRMTEDGRVASIRPQTFFTKYEFLPSPDGGFYGMGLGWLLKDTNEAINSTLNQLFDAGHLNNLQGGFVSAAAGIRDKEVRISKGAFKVINTGGIPLNQAIMPFNYQPPSEALFKLLGLLIEYGNDLASIKDVMTGETGGKVMQPTTVLALIEQGMKVFNAIFKRVHRAIKAELGIHGRLNRENLTPEQYNAFFDDQEQFDPAQDYDDRDMDIVPVSDPTVATRMQALAKAQVAVEIAGPPGGKPWINYPEVDKRAFEAAEIEDADALFVPPQPPPEPDPMMVRAAEAEVTGKEAQARKTDAEAAAVAAKADRDAAEAGAQAVVAQQAAMMPPMPVEAPLPAQPMPTPEEQESAQLDLEAKRIANRKASAELAAMDVVERPDGSVESRTDAGFKAILQGFERQNETLMQGLGLLGQLIAQNAEAQRQSDARMAAILAAPVTLERDSEGKPVGARKVLN